MTPLKRNRRSKHSAPNNPMPPRVSSYSPSGRRHSPDKEVVEKTSAPLWKKLLFGFLAVLLGLSIILAVWDARNITSSTQKLFGDGNIVSLIRGGDLKGQDRGRVNILLVGYSLDDPGHPGASLTDSIIVLSMKPGAGSGYMLSIPRDLYVKIPGGDYAKINEAYSDGGIIALEDIISQDFQIPIDYYALINYASVRGIVNALDGITVNVQSPDPRGLYDSNISPADGGPLKLSNGWHSLDGQTALNLTRARGDSYDSYGFAQADFDRTQHQRQVLTAIKDKLNWKLILNPRKNSKVLNAVADNVKTDIHSSEARPLFGLFNSIPSSGLKSLSLRDLNGHNYLNSYTTIYGQSALVPSAGIDDYSQIVDALAEFSR